MYRLIYFLYLVYKHYYQLTLKRIFNHFLQTGEPNELMEPGPGGEVIENPTNADILHLEASEADRLSGAVMNDYSRELVMVNLK